MLTFLIYANIIFQIFGANYLNKCKPYLIVYTALEKKSLCDQRLYSIFHKSNNWDIIWFDKPFFTLKNSMAKKQMFLW